MSRVIVRWCGAVAGLAVLSIPAENLRAQEAGNPQEGAAFARQNCASCHAVEHGQPSSPDPRAPSFENIAAMPGMTATALSVFLRTPHRGMPDLILKADEIRNVASYILTLKSKP
jgi:cytochrome c